MVRSRKKFVSSNGSFLRSLPEVISLGRSTSRVKDSLNFSMYFDGRLLM